MSFIHFCLLAVDHPPPTTLVITENLCYNYHPLLSPIHYRQHSIRKWELSGQSRNRYSFFPFILHTWCSQKISSPLIIKLTNVKPQQYLSDTFFHDQPYVLMNLLEYVFHCSPGEYNGLFENNNPFPMLCQFILSKHYSREDFFLSFFALFEQRSANTAYQLLLRKKM